MSRVLLITVQLHDDRYHGAGEWPPSPARLFQALVAGAGLSGPLGTMERRTLEWLERLGPPLIGAPPVREGRPFEMYVPNNDMDSVGGDIRRVGKIRTEKRVAPRLIDGGTPFLYAWPIDGGEDDERQAQAMCVLAERLYQFGRGMDMACAWGVVLDDEGIETQLASYRGRIHRPSQGGNGTALACPAPSSLESLEARHDARRFRMEGEGKTARRVFKQPPKARFKRVAYESLPSRRVYELRERTPEASFAVWPLARTYGLVMCVREAAVRRLRVALPDRGADIERCLVGRKADGADAGPTSARVKIVPLPSIGHPNADRGIRRVLVDVPADCPLRADDVHWAFSGIDLSDPETGEVLDVILTPTADESMAAHYGVGEHASSRLWRTVTPIALPEAARRRRIDPARTAAEVKAGAERAAEQARVAAAVAQALRHADVRHRAVAIRAQREPLEGGGERVEAFAPGTRFPKGRLWHVEITFGEPLSGPLVIGDGRFLGLGVMSRVPRTQGVHAFLVEEGFGVAIRPPQIARALRRAVMARVRDVLGAHGTLPTFFSGHEGDGTPARGERSSHLAFQFDPSSAHVLIVAPHVIEHRQPTPVEARHLRDLDDALVGFCELRAGPSGCLTLRAIVIDAASDLLFAPSRTWESVTPYQVTRHTKGVGAVEALAADLRAECHRRGLPVPHVAAGEMRGLRGVGLLGHARLTFEVAVNGPIVLGRSRHLGGGLFLGGGE